MNIKLSSTGLKWIAIITMIIDHIGAVLFPYSEYPDMIFLRFIGRIAFPIFAFLIVEGYRHTKDVKKYGLRLLAFAFISEIPFDLAFMGSILEFEHQNVFFTLFLGLLAIYVFDQLKDKNRLFAIGTVYMIGVIALMLKTDYQIFGVILIFGIYTATSKLSVYGWIIIVNALLAYLSYLSGGSIMQFFSIVSIIFISRYNGQKGKGMKFLFYLIYPAHIFLLFIIDSFLNR